MPKQILVLTLCWLLYACQSEPKQIEYGPRWKKEYATSVPELRKVKYTWQDTVQHYSMTVSYPAILNTPAFSQLVQQSIDENKAQFEFFIRDFDGENRTLNGSFEIIHRSDSVVSIKMLYEWAVPGTSVLQYRFGNLNYQPATESSISLPMIFRSGVDYRRLLKDKLSEKIRSEYNLEEVEITEEDLNTFIIGKRYLEFYKVLYPELMEPAPKAIRVPYREIQEELAW